MSSNVTRVDALNKNNFDTWKLQMEALLTKNEEWAYVSGECPKPAPIEDDEESEELVKRWITNDKKARSDIILCICPSELKQVKGCVTSREMWLKLENIYQSKGPARKATLLKQLTLHKMNEGSDVREHMNKFFDAVDKLNEMGVEINPDLLSIMLLYSLPASFENFRCAIESRDNLPTPETLRVKITEENDAKRSENNKVTEQNVMYAKKHYHSQKNTKQETHCYQNKFKFKCYKCGIVGHKAADCRSKNYNRGNEERRYAKLMENVGLFTSQSYQITQQDHQKMKWCLDSGATSHLCKNRNDFVEVSDNNRDVLNLANNSSTEILAKGTVKFGTNTFGEPKNIFLHDALHVPDLRTNLLSVAKITEKGFDVLFRKNSAFVIGNNGDVKITANRVGDLYFVKESESVMNVVNEDSVCASKVSTNNVKMWHRRMGHLNVRDLIEADRKGLIDGLTLNKTAEQFVCEVCSQGKMTRTPFPKKSKRVTELLDLVHSDVCGPMRVESIGKARYFVEFIDDHSRWCEVRFLKSKSEVIDATKEYITLVENQRGKKIKCFQSDNGTEYTSKEFDNFLKKNGITRRLSIPYHPEQNGIAERRNRTLLDTARCLLMESGLPACFWAEAVNTANYIRNRCPSKSLNGRTPFEIWSGKKPNVSYFREFGCRVLCLNKKPNCGKFEPRCKDGIFVGYSEYSKGFRVWLPQERKIEISRDVKFLEKSEEKIKNGGIYQEFIPQIFSEENEQTELLPRIEVEMNHTENNIQDREEVNEDIQDDVAEQEIECVQEETAVEQDVPASIRDESENLFRRNAGRPRIVRTGLRGRPQKKYHIVNHQANFSEESIFLSEVPMNKAISGPESNEWYDAMVSEIKSIIKNDTWELAERPRNKEVIGSRIVLRNKYNADGFLDKRKARLVAQGFSQKPGIHFNQTFAPVARMSSIRLLVSISTMFNMKIEQFDVATAYLNGKLEEEIFMEPPKQLSDILQKIIECDDSDIGKKALKMLQDIRQGDKVCRLKKSLYGLRQAGRSWHTTLDGVLKKAGLIPTQADPCLYRAGKGDNMVLVAIYVDDILISSKNPSEIKKLEEKLSKKFEIKGLGNVKYCLGVEFERDGGRVKMHQKCFINDLLKRFCMTDCNPVATPMEPQTKLVKNDKTITEENEKLPYQELIGALTYLSVTTRPDISHSVNFLSQFNNCYDKSHWTAAKRILRYLKGTIDLGLVYGPNTECLQGFVDADWANCQIDRRSYTGYVFILGEGPISWDSRKQKTVALSSTEAEYMALTEAAKEAVYLRRLLIELNLDKLANITVYTDNLSALKLSENPVFHARSKHIDVKHHFIREILKNDLLKVNHVSTKEMVADVFTKGLHRIKHENCVKNMGLC